MYSAFSFLKKSHPVRPSYLYSVRGIRDHGPGISDLGPGIRDRETGITERSLHKLKKVAN